MYNEKLTKAERIAFSFLLVSVILALIATIFTWINFLTGIDLVNTGIEWAGEIIYSFIK